MVATPSGCPRTHRPFAACVWLYGSPLHRAVLDRIKLRPLIEYLAHERLHITNAHSEVTFAFTGASLSKTTLSHVSIGNVELERLAELLGGSDK